jgi:hypothetical protein
MKVTHVAELEQLSVCALSAMSGRRHLATNRKVAGARPNERIRFYLLDSLAALCPGVYSASIRNEYQRQK